MNKIGLQTGTSFGLYPMTYHIFVHDPAFFLQNYRPKTFPGFRLKTDFKNYGAAVYISVTKHLELNRESSPCNDDPEYDFQDCVRKKLVRKIGCKLTWDLWTSDLVPVCSEIDDLRKFHLEYANIANKELRNIVNCTECAMAFSWLYISCICKRRGCD